MARMTIEEIREKQEDLQFWYVDRDLTDFKKLQKIVGATEKTLRKWVKELNLDKLKRNLVLTYEEQLSHLLNELVEINAAIKSKPEGERYADYKTAQIRRQITKDIEALQNENAQLPDIISALTQFINFIRKQDLEKAKEISHLANDFLKMKLRNR